MSRFECLTEHNEEKLYRSGGLRKGSLIKFRFLDKTLEYYQLDRAEEMDWHFGIVSKIYWHMSLPPPYIVEFGEKKISERMCFDLEVHNLRLQMLESINTNTHDIHLLNDETTNEKG